MRNIVLSTLSIFALLMYPLSLSAQNSFSLSLDVDGAAGDQAVRSLDISADEVVAIQIFGTGIQNANGLAVRFEYDAAQVVYDGFDTGDVLPNAQALPEHGTGFVEIGIASLGGQATANSGLVGAVRFRTMAGFSGTAIRLVRADLSRSGQFETVNLDIRIALQFQAVTSDFDGDGMVNFSDFLAFAGQFGARQGDGRYEAKYDLDSDGAIGFGDFLLFSSSFGKETDGGGPETQIAIPDANLRAAIETALRKTSGASITRAEMASLTRFEASESDIRDLTGLEFATGLISLILADNLISDLTPLSGLTNLTSLILSDNVISDITPLSGLTDLTLLILSGNFFSDISPLSGLTNLTSLNLSHNIISDISPLSGLTNLSVLILYDDRMIRDRSVLSRLSNLSEPDIPDANLRAAIKIAMGKVSDDPLTDFEMAFLSELEAPNSNIRDLTGLELATSLTSLDLGTEQVSGEGYINSNHISDFSPLLGLTNLTRLALGGNSISDLSTLSGVISRLTRLERLYLNNNSISDVSVLSGLINLERLYLFNNSISDLSSLSGLTRLEWLYLDNNSISDLSPLSGLTNLANLSLSHNSISDLSPLSGLTNLIRLWLYNNSISDVSALSGLTRLRWLYLYNNSISDITPLSGLTSLTLLRLTSNNISDVSALSGLTNLISLTLSSNNISDVSALSGLTNLISLLLTRNSVSDVSALSGLSNLANLSLSLNSISDISALSGLTNLEGLWLYNNSISDISALSGLTNLERLYLYNNSVSDLLPLVANTGLGTGDVVDVQNNPLSATSINTHIPALQDRGIDVRFGALKPAAEKEERDIFPEMMELLEGDERRN